jgi:hypothetical protein
MRWTLTLFIIFPLLLPLALHADYELAEPPTSWRYPPEMPGSRIEVYRQAGEVKLNLPFKGLGIKAPKPGDVWGINFSRMDQPGKLDMDLMQNSSWGSITKRGFDHVSPSSSLVARTKNASALSPLATQQAQSLPPGVRSIPIVMP